MVKTLKPTKPKLFKSKSDAVEHITQLYREQVEFLRAAFADFEGGKLAPNDRFSGFYPYFRIATKIARRKDTRRSYGFAPKPGIYSTTVTHPDIFKEYYLEQLELIIQNHDVEIEVGISKTNIPIHFALGENYHPEKGLTAEDAAEIPLYFDVPNLEVMDDEIANGTYVPAEGEDHPLSLFTAPRIDISLQRLRHYCGTSPSEFQDYVIFTNYQFYIDEFVRMGQNLAKTKGYEGFSMPDPRARRPQMPAYHLKRADRAGVTMVNIGVGPSNAKTITDHIAVLRPHAWIMLGHCAGLRNSQRLGDYVLAHGYLREDNILDEDLPTSIPIPPLAEIQQSIQQAVAEVTGYENYELKKIMRTGTVATTDDRNWELHASIRQNRRLSQSRAIAMDMESGTIAANGFRFRVPYGTLLCVSDKPLHGQPKLPGMADDFYRSQVEQHLQVGLRTLELLKEYGPAKLHSRKLRSFDEVAFR